MTLQVERIIRPSSLTTFADCPRRWAARTLRAEVTAAGYDLAKPRASGAGALVGTGVHAGAAATLQAMREDETGGREDLAIAAAIDGFRERAEAEGAEWDETTPTANTAEQQILRMTKVFRRQVAPTIKPVLIEERAEVTVAPGFILSGQLDALSAAVSKHDPETIRDTKTGTTRRANGIQYGAYSLIYEAHGYEPRRLVEDFIPRVRISKEQPDASQTEFNWHDARMDAWQSLNAIMRDTNGFAARADDPNGDDPRGAFRPNPSSSLCSARWCPAHGTRWCRSHRPTE